MKPENREKAKGDPKISGRKELGEKRKKNYLTNHESQRIFE